MNFNFLPTNYINALSIVDSDYIYEIRLRIGYPVKINFKNKNYYLSYGGLSVNNKNAIICKIDDIKFIINKVTENSIYAYNDRIKEGYISTRDGIRIGLGGECVFVDGKIHTIKNFSSLNIRVPHHIKNCSKKIFDLVCKNNCCNSTLISSPPFLGKTTILKDLALKLNEKNLGSVLLIDERGEFSCIEGQNIDKISYSDKQFAFNIALRALSPSIVITDELSSLSDWKCALNAVNSGVKILASTHSDNLLHLQNKQGFISGIFDRYIFLKNDKFGKIDKVYDKIFMEL